MFTLITTVGVPEVFKREFMPFAAAFLIAEFFYKFHSFALECAAFLLTWWLCSFIQSRTSGARPEA